MEKAKYIIINSEEKYFIKISENNKIVFTDSMEEATKVSYDESQDLIPLIELYSGHVAQAEPV